MDKGLKVLVNQIDQLRDSLHKDYAQDGFSAELLLLSQKLDQLILEYVRLQRTSKSC